MSAYREVELRCDAFPGDPYGCTWQIFDRTATRARRDARSHGWATGLPGGRDLCPDHRPAVGAQPEETTDG